VVLLEAPTLATEWTLTEALVVLAAVVIAAPERVPQDLLTR
jgi:hypothetical protein